MHMIAQLVAGKPSALFSVFLGEHECERKIEEDRGRESKESAASAASGSVLQQDRTGRVRNSDAMPPGARNPVKIEPPFSVVDSMYSLGSYQGSGCHLSLSRGGRQVGRRRVFVQIETGNVLGIELDRAEKADALKKKVQAALCVPTEQSDLLLGDHVLDNDLTELRQDSPLLLTRGLHRSSSTPCLSLALTEGIQTLTEWRNSQPIEIVGGHHYCPGMKELVRETIRGIECGMQPCAASGGLGGAYYFRNRNGESVAIVKPTDEEPFAPNNPNGFVGRMLGQPGLKRSIRVGETGIREVAAYILDHEQFANVPRTALVKAKHAIFNVNVDVSRVQLERDSKSVSVAKICSYQEFVKHDFDASELGTALFPVSQVHRIGILDVRILNTDRHAGNILIRRIRGKENRASGGKAARGGDSREWSLRDEYVLVPIDHGLCLPETLEDPYFEWLHWPQASLPFSEDELRYIEFLDPFQDAEKLRRQLPMIREASLRVLIICTLFLQSGAAAGLNLAEIGGMMSRDDEEPSLLESICMLAKLNVEPEESWLHIRHTGSDFDSLSSMDDQFQLELDRSSSGSGSGHSPLDDEAPGFSTGGADGCRYPDGLGFRSPLGYSRGHVLSFESPFADDNVRSPISYRTHSPMSSPMSPMSPMSSLTVRGGGGGGGIREAGMVRMMAKESLEDAGVPLRVPALCRYISSPASPPPCVPPARDGEKELRQTVSFDGGRFYASRPCRGRTGNNYSASSRFALTDMKDGEWGHFLNFFQDLLPQILARHIRWSVKGTQRLGTSCRF